MWPSSGHDTDHGRGAVRSASWSGVRSSWSVGSGQTERAFNRLRADPTAPDVWSHWHGPLWRPGYPALWAEAGVLAAARTRSTASSERPSWPRQPDTRRPRRPRDRGRRGPSRRAVRHRRPAGHSGLWVPAAADPDSGPRGLRRDSARSAGAWRGGTERRGHGPAVPASAAMASPSARMAVLRSRCKDCRVGRSQSYDAICSISGING